MRKIALVVVASVSMALAGCEQTGLDKQTVGTGAGALIGGVLGSQVGGGSGRLWATGAGVLLGALAGSEIGASLDRADRMYMQKASSQAHTAPIGESIAWNNPESGHSGAITPVRDGTSNAGNYCREYQQSIYIDGQEEVGVGTACQNSDGTWQISN